MRFPNLRRSIIPWSANGFQSGIVRQFKIDQFHDEKISGLNENVFWLDVSIR